MAPLALLLDPLTAPAELAIPQANGSVRCTACGHRCLVRPGRRGICRVRFNKGGSLRVPWGYVSGLNADPVEKKPFYHFLPGSTALTFGMLGCDFHCGYCQNWLTSQALRDPAATELRTGELVQRVRPEQIVAYARRMGADALVSSYNEPLITTEWSLSIFQLAVKQGLRCAYVSNGNATPEALAALRPYLSAYKVDLKTMQDKNYRQLGGVLQHVLDTIRAVHALGLWLEVVTLVVPGFNDSPGELWEAARFLASVSPDIPWHVTAFHPDYHMQERPATGAASLQQAAEIGQEAGLHFVYAGNLPGRVGSLEDTFCPHCQAALVRRRGYVVYENRVTDAGTCPKCGTAVPGVWK
jgi:pyruvate formate lyase activating enzyme